MQGFSQVGKNEKLSENKFCQEKRNVQEILLLYTEIWNCATFFENNRQLYTTKLMNIFRFLNKKNYVFFGWKIAGDNETCLEIS